ncbi:MAG: DUF1294 domain-containing protein [Planctomycetes bacterium]|nr:DUF1294 domain-containing protein [Planctomycetota bacterium]
MGIDKALAATGRSRISERALLIAAFFGGAPGLWAGMFLFRHKTHKPGFYAGAVVAAVASVVVFTLGRTYGL